MTSSTVASSEWHRVLGVDGLPEGRVRTVVAGHRELALTHVDGRYGALDNRCPHQRGPLGEGSIEKGMLRCPWHGYDYCPLTGRSEYGDGVDSFRVEVRDDGIYVQVPVERPHERTTTDVLAETLIAWGVRHVFGMVGHSNLGMADAIRRQVEAGRMEYVGIRHEGAAAFAASAYGKLTGRPAACLTIAGPGATNLLTGLYDAHVDRAPVIALCGQVATQILGPGDFQEVDLLAAFSPVVAWQQTLHSSSDPAALASLAAKNAIVRQQPVQLVLPDKVQTAPAADRPAGTPDGRVGDPRIAPPIEALDDAVALLGALRRPVIIAGHGARGSADRVRALAERLRAPVITTFKAKGLIADDHPLACGVLGRSGTPVASWFMNEADGLLVLGASFSTHTGIYAGKPIVQVDSDRMQLGKFHAVTAPVWGDVGVTVDALIERLERAPVDQAAEIAERKAIWAAEKASRAADDRGCGVSSAAVFAALSAAVPEHAVIAVDVGNNTYSFGRYFESKSHQDVLMSGYLGSIGFGYPAAIGAWAAVGGARPVWCVSGDGGFGQYLAEITTAVKHGMAIKHLLLNNGQLGKISKEQRAGSWDVWQTELVNPSSFAAYAELCGALGIRVAHAGELPDAFARAAAHDGPALVEVVSDPELT